MKKLILLSSITGLILMISSCASIVSKSIWPLTVNSNPSGAVITISDRNSAVVYKSTTPANVKLKSGAGFFKKESYKIKFELSGYDVREIPVECKLNGWYWGNIFIGGLIGMLIVDPATGAMYKLDAEYITENLSKKTGSIETEPQLIIYEINDISKNLKEHLVKMN